MAVTFGSAYAFNAFTTNQGGAIQIDATHYVIAYGRNTGAGLGAVIATISGNTISYGTPVTVYGTSAFSPTLALIDSTHFVMSFRGDSTNNGYAVIGTISGTSITFGSLRQYAFSTLLYQTVTKLLSSTSFLTGYTTLVGGSFGQIMVGGISGTTPSYAGTPQAVDGTNNIQIMDIAVIDSTHFVVFYVENAGNGYARVGTVSGSSITFGTAVQFTSTGSGYGSIALIDSTHFIISYSRTADACAIIGTISGTTVSFAGSETALNAVASNTMLVSLLDSTHFVTVYSNGTNFVAVIGTISGSTITHGAENGFGVTNGSNFGLCKIDSSNFFDAFMGASNFGSAIVGTIVPDSVFIRRLTRLTQAVNRASTY